MVSDNKSNKDLTTNNDDLIDVCSDTTINLEEIVDFKSHPVCIGKKYKIIDKIGEGGTSNIYKAINIEQDNIVALKIIKKQSKVVSAKQRFELEGQTLKAFESNPNILKIYEFFKIGEYSVIVMEYLEGKTLKEIMKKEQIISPKRAIDWTLKTINALKDLHDKNIMHRDIKPQNIIINGDSLKLTDFGIVQASESQDITQTNYVVGSVEYMSPEVLKGQKATPRSEIYSIGIILYSMLSGIIPLKGMDFQDTAKKHLSKNPTELYIANPNLDKKISSIVMKCLKLNDFERYADVWELEEALIDYLAYLEKQKNNKDKNFFKNDEIVKTGKNKFLMSIFNYKFISIISGLFILVILIIAFFSLT